MVVQGLVLWFTVEILFRAQQLINLFNNIWDWDIIFLVRKTLFFRGPRNLFNFASHLGLLNHYMYRNSPMLKWLTLPLRASNIAIT